MDNNRPNICLIGDLDHLHFLADKAFGVLVFCTKAFMRILPTHSDKNQRWSKHVNVTNMILHCYFSTNVSYLAFVLKEVLVVVWFTMWHKSTVLKFQCHIFGRGTSNNCVECKKSNYLLRKIKLFALLHRCSTYLKSTFYEIVNPLM